MIYVTVGLHNQGFDRLIKKMDEIANKINEEIIMQIGSTKYQPKYAEFFSFTADNQKIISLIKQSRLVISHAGAGTVLYAFKYKKPLILVPRLAKYHEHHDNQQIELANELAKEGIPVVYDVDKLELYLNIAGNQTRDSIKKLKLKIFLKEYLRDIDECFY